MRWFLTLCLHALSSVRPLCPHLSLPYLMFVLHKVSDFHFFQLSGLAGFHLGLDALCIFYSSVFNTDVQIPLNPIL